MVLVEITRVRQHLSLTERQFFPGEKHSAHRFSDTGL